MKKKYYCFYLLLCISLYALAQTTTSIKDSYKNYFKFSGNEAIFIHLNKTSYLVGEEIWFKGYVFDKRNEKKSVTSTNLYVGLYDVNGKQISKKLFLIRNGLTHGNLELKKELNSGTYYIKGATQKMIDEASDEVFIEKITIYGKNYEPQQNNTTAKKYDIQFLPEGGHLVKNIENTVAFKAINQEGKGVYARGIIYDENNDEITTFESNNYGIGTVQLTPKANQVYKASTTFEEEKTSEQTLPKIENTGITVRVNNIEKDSVKIALNTNAETLRSIVSKDYTLLIHKDGLTRSMPFSFKNTETVDLTIARSGLFNGVNTITLFDGKTPVLERMFFNNKVEKNASILLKKLQTKNDESEFSLYLIKRKSGLLEANVSISILPETTEAYNPANSIFSSFYLKPYVHGAVENPKYYFPNNTKTKRKALDALLITQGWSKYDWTTIFQNTAKKLDVQQGITINGTVNFPTKDITGIFLHDTKQLPSQYVTIDKDRKFVINNLYPEADEELRFSYINNKQEFLKPKLYLRYSVNSQEDAILKNAIVDRSFLNETNIFILPNGFFPKDAEALDAVLLEGKGKKEKENIDPMMVNAKEIKIGMKEYMQYPEVKNIIENSGYDVSDDPFDMQNLRIFTRKRLTLQAGNPPGFVSPLIFLDGAPLSDFSILRNFSTANVERVVINKTGQGYGVRGIGGVIKIYSRKTPLHQRTNAQKETFAKHLPPVGFSVAKQYYEPKYQSFTGETYQKYAAIDWRPMNNIPRRGAFNFFVKHKHVKGITMFIEGISKDGSLISEKRTIALEEDE
ncbi:MAG: hypothetical protein AB8B65_18895 [Kordia sp.]|uniref:hypothetical protein n=1 Tax=Kordia sp. TaxID=1965332 RepID=UPI00385F3864